MKRLFSLIFMLFSFSFLSTLAAKSEQKPKVSIVVPVYGVERWLPECMDSLMNQTLKEIEIICVDDGSPDNCGKMLDEYAKKDARIKVIHKENGGVQRARNAGLDAATGEYIALVDSDDYVDPHTYEVAYNYAKKDNVDVLHFGHRTFDDGKDDHKNYLDLSDGPVTSLKEYWKKHEGFYVWDNLFKAEIIQKDKIRFIPGIRPADDTCFTYSAMGRAKRIKSIPARFYSYRIRPCALSRMTFADIFINSYKMFKHICDSWRQGGCIKGQENLLLTTIIRWSRRYHDTSLDYAQEVLDSFGDDVYNDKVVRECPKYVQKEIDCLKTAAKYGKISHIEEGIYRIASSMDSGKVLDICGGSKDSTANLQIWGSNFTDAQKFKVTRTVGGAYKITALHSGKALDVVGARKEVGTNIWQYDTNDSAAQKWYIVPCANGCYKIISQSNFLAMDISGNNAKNGANIHCWTPHNGNNQKFKFIKVDDINRDPISIAMASDRNYAYPTIVSMTSILENRDPGTKINFYIMLSGNFEQSIKNDILSLKDKYPNCDINLIDMKDKLSDLYTSDHLTAATYYRLLLPDLLPNLDKVLYLDTDIIVQKDLTSLFKHNIDNFYLAGVRDVDVCGIGILNWKSYRHGHDFYTRKYGENTYINCYVNAGILLFNLKNMRENNLVPKLLDCAQKHDFINHDQCVLNTVCYGKILPIFDIYNRAVWLGLNDNQVVVRYCGGEKPWKDLNCSQADLWWKYAEKAPCFNKIQEKYLLPNGTYTVSSSLNPNKVWDIRYASKENGANLQLWDKNNSSAQKFNIKYIGSKLYEIKSKCSNKMIDVQGAGKEEGTGICQYKNNDSDAQKWYIIPCGEKLYKIVSKCNNLAVDVDSACTENGTSIRCWKSNGTNAQKFKFNRVS